MALENGRFVQKDYHKATPFASFLPGISGVHGIPTWCYYVNRGQGVACFGTENKDHSIMEFFPAHQAYQQVGTLGFRTFLKVDGGFVEPFAAHGAGNRSMSMGMSDLVVEETLDALGLRIQVCYYTLPGEALGGLVREVTLENTGAAPKRLELLDGMPALIPYGIDLRSLKEMGQTMKAWMQVEDHGKKLPYYRTRISTKDSAEVEKVERGNYYFTLGPENTLLPMVVDPSVVFDYDLSLREPLGFLTQPLEKLLSEKQMTMNQLPCAFSAWQGILAPGACVTFTSVSGMAENKGILEQFAKSAGATGFFSEKRAENARLGEELTQAIQGRTGHGLFDAYARQTYLDNLIRGGHPIVVGDKVLHVYARKHGDMERDYNFFSLLPEYYSQGNGNFRDVNQNRRSDVRFHPYVGTENIKTFYNLIQLDGYNPLVVKPTTYRWVDRDGLDVLVGATGKQRLLAFFEKEFSPGGLLRLLESEDLALRVEKEVFLQRILAQSREVQHAEFHEGYWTDHFVYNLDQVEAYLSVYPEKRSWLLFEDMAYSYRVPEAKVLPRSLRYVQGKEGLRQYKSLESMPRSKGGELLLGPGGDVYRGSLAQKFLVLLGTKFSSLDPSGRGIDMEAGKPGWYDALNGLPGIFGSSVADACELLRFMKFFYAVLQDETREIQVPTALALLLHDIMDVLSKAERGQSSSLEVWKGLNQAKEDYREKIYGAFDGEETAISAEEVRELLHACMEYLSQGITAAAEENQGICPTYYYYDVESFQGEEGALEPLAFQRRTLPLFLEGAVKYLGLLEDPGAKRDFARKVRESDLYDPLLHMYKVNASLEKVSFDVGRAKAFTPGWLENESIWLHMSYKYLLALLKSGLHAEFHKALETSCIPFLKAEVYGRSLLENSSFIASSANPDARIHGKGFVARLSGSTAEFLDIWQRMMFGDAPFTMVEGRLTLRFQPSLPEMLVGEDKAVQAVFLGKVPVTYHLPRRMALMPGAYRVERILVTDAKGHTEAFTGDIPGAWAERIRSGQVEKIDITLAE